MTSANSGLAPTPATPLSNIDYQSPGTWDAIDQKYRYWRFRVLGTALVGYALYYFVRTNIGPAVPAMQRDLKLTNEQLGLVMTYGGVAYGVSKFANGFLGDRANPRSFMAIGLLSCAALNFFFGASSSLVLLCTFWLLNNWAQGMGFPPCAKTMAHWFSPKERSTTFGIWHAGHTLGAAFVGVLASYLIAKYGNWRLAFYVPACLAVGGAILVWLGLRDTPATMGLPPVEVYKREEPVEAVQAETGEGLPYWVVVRDNVFRNPYMWIISVANFLVYILRYTSLNWGPKYLQEFKGVSVIGSGWLLFGSEVAGFASALVAGIVADRVFHGRAGRVCTIAMALMIGLVYIFWKTPGTSQYAVGTLFILMAYMVYVPQMLIASMAMNLGTKRASAAAVGLTGILGYASTLVSGFGLGRIVDRHGWDGAFIVMIICAAGTMLLMALTWNVGAHPQLEHPPGTDDLTPHPGTGR